MSLEKGFSWSYKNFDFKGFSLAGQSTSLMFQNPKICFDIGQGLPFNISAKFYCLTHLHADHGSGINYVLSQRSLFRLPKAKIMLPKSVIPSLEIIIKEWMKIEGFEYQYELIGVEDGFVYDFDKNYSVRAFKTTHRVDSFGYLVYEKKKKLKQNYKQLSRDEILKLKSQKIAIEEEAFKPIVCFTGDTQIEFLKSHPDVLKSQILFMECTYLNEQKSIEETRQWGHTHFDEIMKNQDLFKNEHISLIHLSARYKTSEAEKIISQKASKEFQDKVSIFPRSF